MTPKSVFAVNFWDGFSLDSGFVSYLLNLAFGSFTVAESEREADLVLSSVFINKAPAFPERTLCFLWENFRPNYAVCRYSISGDFDSYGGRNCRVPFWYTQLQWPDYAGDRGPPGLRNHGFEPLADIGSLLRPRAPDSIPDRNEFCCMVANNAEMHRMLCVEALSRVGQVDLHGNIVAKPIRASKYKVLSRYRFNLCFENSAFPGYYTEKLLHAWVAGCVPLYYSDSWYVADFNPKALINRVSYRSLSEFVEHVAQVNRSRAAREEILTQPLLTKRPSLDAVIGFLRSAAEQIARDRPR